MWRTAIFLCAVIIFILTGTQSVFAETLTSGIAPSAGTITKPTAPDSACEIPSGNVTFQSDASIILKPGFWAKKGSSFHAFITGYEGGVEHNTVDGYVRIGGIPVEGAVVALTGSDRNGNKVNFSTKTNASGYYRFTDLLNSDSNGYTLTPSYYTSSFSSRVFRVAGNGQTVTQNYSDSDAVPRNYYAGSMPGNFNVDRNGAANYSIPIQTPPGINGIEPHLSVNYNSSSGDGLMGVGFFMGGLQAITRGPTTLARSSTIDPVDFDGNDVFRLNGQDLVCVKSTYGADGAEYRTEVETFSKIVSNGSANGAPLSFTVWTKDGFILKFGLSDNSRIRTSNGNILVWALESMEDRAGNRLVVTYGQDQAKTEYWPDRIDYAYLGTEAKNSVRFEYATDCPRPLPNYIKGNLRQVTRRLSSIKTYAADKLVTDYFFQYEKDANGRNVSPSRLALMSHCDAQMGCLQPTVFTRVDQTGADDFIRDYLGVNSALQDKTNARMGDFDGDGRNDLVFASNGNFYVWKSNGTSLVQNQTIWGSGHTQGSDFKVCDVNGDGKDDIVAAADNHLYVWITNSSGDGFGARGDWGNFAGDLSSGDVSLGIDVGDFNGDGRADIFHYIQRVASNTNSSSVTRYRGYNNYTGQLIAYKDEYGKITYIEDCNEFTNSYRIVAENAKTPCGTFLTEYDSWVAYTAIITGTTTYTNSIKSSVWITNSSANGFERSATTPWHTKTDMSQQGRNVRSGDFNGDGLSDIVTFWGSEAYVSISKGSGFDYTWQPWKTGLVYSTSAQKLVQVGDFNGDGKTDVIGRNPGTGELNVWISTGAGFCSPDHVWGTGFNDSEINYLGDYNGDGKTDVLSLSANNNGTVESGLNVYLSNGKGFISNSNNALDHKKWSVNASSSYGTPSQIIIGDITGDGSTDLIDITSTAINLYSSRSSFKTKDLLNTITDGLGKSIVPSYSLLTSYPDAKENNVGSYPFRDYLGPLPVVASYTESNGVAGSTTGHSYKYKGAKIDLSRKAFLGFRTVEKTITRGASPDVVDTTTSTYLQNFPFTGMMASMAVNYKRSGQDSQKLKNIAYTNTAVACRPSTLTNFSSSDALPAVTADMSFFPYCSMAIDDDYYPSSSGDVNVKKTTTENSYLESGALRYGTLVSQKVTRSVGGGATGSQYVENIQNTDFVSDETDWVVGKIGRTVSTSSDEDGNSYNDESVSRSSMSLTTSFEYYLAGDAAGYPGQIKRACIAPGNANPYLTLTREYAYTTSSSTCLVKGLLFSINENGSDGYHLDNGGNRTTSFDYDYSSKDTFAVKRTMPEGLEETGVLSWAFGSPLYQYDPNQQQTSWTYDTCGRKMRENRPDHTTTTYAYDSGTGGHPSPVASAAYHVHAYETGKADSITFFDILNRPIGSATKGTDGAAAKDIYTLTVYDDFGRVSSTTLPYFSSDTTRKTTLYEYSLFDYLGKATAFDTGVTTYEYNILDATFPGLTTSIKQTRGTTILETRNTYNAHGLVSRVKDAAGNTTSYGYDPFGNLDYIKDPPGNETKIVYDERGRKTRMKDPDMGTWLYTYNSFDDLIRQKDAKAQEVSMNYDRLGRLLGKGTDPDPTKATYRWYYDVFNGTVVAGKLLNVKGPDGYSQTITYDDHYRPKKQTTAVQGKESGTLVLRTYDITTDYSDTTGWVTKVTYPTVKINSTTTDTLSVNYTYDSYGNVIRASSGTTVFWEAKGRNALGQLTKEAYANGVTTTASTYDPATGRPTSILTLVNGSTKRQNLTYAYDDLGNLTSRANGVPSTPVTETFTGYDNLNRLTTTKLGSTTKSYTYDAIGNITQNGTYLYGSRTVGGVAVTGGPHAVTSAEGGVYTYDANGTMTSGGGRTFTADAFNRITKVANSSTAHGAFVYDEADQVLRQTITNGSTVTETIFVGGLYEKVTTGSAVEHRQYIMAEGQAVAVYTRKYNNTTPQVRYLHKDYLGSTDVITNKDGSVAESISFTAFGKGRSADNWSTAKSMPTGTTQHGYTGHLQLDLFGLIHMGGRIYDYKIARFISADPIIQDVYNPQNLNRYSYCLNNPLKYVDPTGLSYANGIPLPDVDLSSDFGWDLKDMLPAEMFTPTYSLNIVFGTYGGDGLPMSYQLQFSDETMSSLSLERYASEGDSTRYAANDSIIRSDTSYGYISQSPGMLTSFMDSMRTNIHNIANPDDSNRRDREEFLFTVFMILGTPLMSGEMAISGAAEVLERSAAKEAIPQIGSKLDFFLGKATGSIHGIERSTGMLTQLERIGLPDNPATRKYLTEHLTDVINNSSNIVRIQETGRVVRESLLMGPNGGVKFETIWDGTKLITGKILGGR